MKLRLISKSELHTTQIEICLVEAITKSLFQQCDTLFDIPEISGTPLLESYHDIIDFLSAADPLLSLLPKYWESG